MKKYALLILVFCARALWLNAQNEYLDSLHQLLRGADDSTTVTIYRNISLEWESLNSDSALFYTGRSLEFAKRTGSASLQSKCYLDRGIVYKQMGQKVPAVENLLMAEKKGHEADNLDDVFDAWVNLGNLYAQFGETETSDRYFEQCIAVREKITSVTDVAAAYINYGMSQYYKGDPRKMIAILEEGLDYLLANGGDPLHESKFYSNLAYGYREIGQYQKSVELGLNSIALKKNLGDTYGMSNVMNLVASCYRGMKKYSEAIQYSGEALALADSIDATELKMDATYTLSEIYEGMGDYKTALDYYKQYKAYEDTLVNIESETKAEELKTQYETEKKDDQIKGNTETIRLQNIGLALAGLMVFLLIVFLVIFIILLRKTRKAEKGQREANATKAKLFGIISHDLRSPVSSLFQFLYIQQEAPGYMNAEQEAGQKKNILQASQRLLSEMEGLLAWSKSQMERFLPAKENVQLIVIADELIRFFEPLAKTKNVQLVNRFTADHRLYSDPYFVRIILRNLVQNAIQHSTKGTDITVGYVTKDKRHGFFVRSYGVKLPPGILAGLNDQTVRSSETGLGLRLVSEMVQKLEGEFFVEASFTEGTEFRILLS